MEVIFWGAYDKKPRLKILIEGLKANGARVKEIHFNLWKGIADKSQVKPLQWLKILASLPFGYLFLATRLMFTRTPDCLIVGYPGYLDILLARMLTAFKKKPLIVLDAFMSLYDTVVCDRKIVAAGGFFGRLLLFIDRIACISADRVLCDTESHACYFARSFGIPGHKFLVAYIGASKKLFFPEEKA